jgi:2-polyprenyl-6-methoxyphenol hydroxylase-like FAD-dependent oxidoreductase
MPLAPHASPSTPSQQTPVLIVGAGPTGLLLASELARRSVPCHLIDARPAPLHWDRATVIHPRSLQIFESMGIADKFLAAGCRQRIIRVHARGKLLGMMDLANCGSVYGYNVGLSEEVTESILTAYLHEHGGEVHRASRLTALTPHANGVLAEIQRDGATATESLDAQWVVGCDGIHSPTRELTGIAFEGHDIAKAWAVFDASVDGWIGTPEGNFGFLDDLPVLLTALPGKRFRVYMRPGSEESDLVAEATVTLRRYLPTASFTNVENPTRFQCHTKVARHFRDGRIFLAGDAAHLCSPAEGHGMNCGLQDAFNLAWKLALVYHGHADAQLLDSYELERRPVAERVAKSGDAVEEAHSLSRHEDLDKRDAAIAATFADPAKRHHEMAAETELISEYSQSPIVFGDANSALAAGRRLPDTMPLKLSGGAPNNLHALGHRAGHTILLLAGPSADLSAAANLYASLKNRAATSEIFEAAVAFAADSHVNLPQHFGTVAEDAAAQLGVAGATLLVIRPDGYIGLRADRDHLGALERYSSLVTSGRATGSPA